MPIFKCKTCGGTIELSEGATVGVCESCGTKQTLPGLENEKRAAAKKRKKIIAVTALVLVICIAFLLVLTRVIIPNNKYSSALNLYNAGRYDEAITAFKELNGYKDSEAQLEKCYIGKYGEENYNLVRNINVGDTFKFGSYEQNNVIADGKEEIEWIVLEKDGMSLLLISKYALDCQQYNTSYTGVTWETCSLRKWLNETFISNAFSEDEQSMIQTTTVTADENPSYSTSPDNSTSNKAFLLSISEANKYFIRAVERRCAPTDYAKAKGAYQSDNYTTGGKAACRWWLRSPGGIYSGAAFVNSDGFVYRDGDAVDRSDFAVRPALWIDLDS